jgi:putative pyruvate formate lyase activating enzyme
MWYLLRPDAAIALEDPLVKKILPRYVKVVKDKLPARFQIAKRIAFDFSQKLSTQQLWKEHSKLMKKFYKTKDAIDAGKLNLNDLEIQKSSLLDLKILLTQKIMESCELCERKCRVNRLEGELGECKIGNKCIISSEGPHYGEESYYVPSYTIFFYSCNFHCQYCQNYMISQRLEEGTFVTSQFLARRIEEMRANGFRNANFVGGEPTPQLLWILEALKNCKANIPTLWNSNMYMSEKTMQILDGIVDVYLTDLKYGNDDCALRLSKVSNYWKVATRNHLLAAKQTELTIRQLVLPSHVECCTFVILKWIAKNLKNKCLVNIMDQYYPCYLANQYPEINRRLTEDEYQKALEKAEELKLNVKD